MSDISLQGLAKIAGHCPEYESVATAQFGLSLSNLTGEEDPRCDYCVYWQNSTCSIFLSALYPYTPDF